MQTVKAVPCKKYLGLAWVKADAAGAECGGKLTVRLRDQKGSWHYRA